MASLTRSTSSSLRFCKKSPGSTDKEDAVRCQVSSGISQNAITWRIRSCACAPEPVNASFMPARAFSVSWRQSMNLWPLVEAESKPRVMPSDSR